MWILNFKKNFLNFKRISSNFTAMAVSSEHRHRIDKYLDTPRRITITADRVATDHFQKSKSQDGGLPELLLAYSCLTNHSEAASL